MKRRAWLAGVAAACLAICQANAAFRHAAIAGAGGGVPGSISNLAIATRGANSLDVTFTTPSGSPTSYEYRFNGGSVLSGPVSGTISSLTAGTDYGTLEIRGKNGSGAGPWSNVVQAAYTYPDTVVTKSLQSVWDQFPGRLSPPGIVNATNKTLGVDTPPCGSYSNPVLTISGAVGTCTFDRWDFTGKRIDIDCTSGTLTFSNFKFAGSSQSAYLRSGANSAASCAIVIQDGEYDGAGRDTTYEAGIRFGVDNGDSGNHTIQRVWFHNDPNDYISEASTGTHSYCNNLFRSPGNGGTDPAKHLEVIHYFGGTPTLCQNLFDLRDWNGVAGVSGYAFVEPISSNISSTFSQNVIMGVSSVGSGGSLMAYAEQIRSASAGSPTVNVSNTVTEPGASGTYSKSGGTYSCTSNLVWPGGGADSCP